MSQPRQSPITAPATGGAGAPEDVASRAAVAGHPIHPMLIPFPIALLVAALAADVAYAVTDDAFFARMAMWLVGGGLLTGLLAMVAGVVDFFSIRRARESRAGRLHAWGNGAVLALTAVNLGVRVVSDAEAAVVPAGLALSAVVALLLAVTGWYGGEMSYRMLVGASPVEEVLDEAARADFERPAS